MLSQFSSFPLKITSSVILLLEDLLNSDEDLTGLGNFDREEDTEDLLLHRIRTIFRQFIYVLDLVKTWLLSFLGVGKFY